VQHFEHQVIGGQDIPLARLVEVIPEQVEPVVESRIAVPVNP